jgi:hypothetical protein
MKNLCILIFLFATTIDVNAQLQKQIGINLLPLSVKSFEITSEFSKNPTFSLTMAAGYVHKTGYEGISGSKVYDGISGRQTSGAFYKIGGRVYLLSMKGQRPKFNIFLGAQLIGASYSKTGRIINFTSSAYPYPETFTSKKGISLGPALTSGITFRLSGRLDLDAGIQYGFIVTKHNDLGSDSFNYDPGFGSSRSVLLIPILPPFAAFATNAQGILNLKYRL